MGKAAAWFIILFRQSVRWHRVVVGILFVITLAAVFVLRGKGYLTPDVILALPDAYPLLAPLLFIFLYGAMIVMLIPTLPMNLGAGLLWGGMGGGLVALAGSSLGAVISFFVARYLARDYLKAKFDSRIWQWLEHEMAQNDWKIIAFIRMNPVFSFSLSNYFFGISAVPFKRYLWATVLPVVPGVIIFASVGDSIGDIVLKGSANNIVHTVFIFSLGATLLIGVPWFVRRYWKYADENVREAQREITS